MLEIGDLVVFLSVFCRKLRDFGSYCVLCDAYCGEFGVGF